MDEHTLISFIVPVYNGEKYIERCLNSISRQTYTNIEIVVVNDGSTDKTLDIIRKCASVDDRIRFFSKENSGVSETRNFALHKIHGEYVFFVDADDWIDYNMAEDNLHIINDNNNLDIIINDFYYNLDNSVRVSETFSMSSGEISPDIIKRTLIATDAMNSQCISLYSVKIIRDHNISFPEKIKYGEDNIFNLIFADFTGKAFYTKKAFYHYEIHKGSGCRRLHNDHLEVYEQQFNIKKHYANKWQVLDNSTLIDLSQLVSTHLAAFSLMAQRSMRYTIYKNWMKEAYDKNFFQWLVQNTHNLQFDKIPRTYKLLVRMIVKHEILISYLYCAYINYILGLR